MAKLKITSLISLVVITGIGFNNHSYSQNKKDILMKEFKINVEDSKITDLKNRIRNTRWIADTGGSAWSSELSIQYLKELTHYWLNDYDWKKQEKYLNSFRQYRTVVDSCAVHFVYEKGSGTKHIPVLLLHGWAANFTQYLRVVELLKKENPDLDLIVPSLPGFAFSETPDIMNSDKVALLMHKLMTDVLGYRQYYIHGKDFGSFVGEKMAMDYPESVKGLHLSDIPYYHLYGQNENLSNEEEGFINKINEWSMMDGAYASIQGTRPKILSSSLNDSPVGLAAWLLQLFHSFSDKNKDMDARYNKDELLTNISIYWFTETIYSSMRIYSEDTHGFGEAVTQKTTVPAGFCFYPSDIMEIPPKEFVNRFFSNICSWTELKEGGHFGTMEDPNTLHQDLVNFIALVEENPVK